LHDRALLSLIPRLPDDAESTEASPTELTENRSPRATMTFQYRSSSQEPEHSFFNAMIPVS
jgi:hypothetical protein